MKTIDKNNKPASDNDKPPRGLSRDRIRQDKFSTLPLPWFLSDINTQKA